MIRRPGHLNQKEKEMLYWVPDAEVMLETGWTEEQMQNTSIVTIRRLKTLLRGRADAQKQMNQWRGHR